ncbi:3945_t:CDS:2 [Diversispora eburnea]|uniref:Vacuolar membrane-associated protein IML1 n=1 Tax=Diversispora eburnea TaxID=1213867 RepID=A0A9N8VQA4_9GLOM|nr:3945_t:CDS:2 [Diversispora eburnea]
MTTSTPSLKKALKLGIHNSENSKQEFIINPDCFPGIRPGQLLMIVPQNEEPDTRNNLIVRVNPFDKVTIDKPTQISISSDVAAAFGLKWFNVMVSEKSVEADYIEFCFRDQYIGRSDMWRLARSLKNTCVYQDKRIEFASCIRAQVKKIYVKGEQVKCGMITENTKAIFRSESAKLFIFVQMSREMWEFDEDGELYYEKAVGFFTELFHNWKEMGTNHVVSIVLFSRIFYDYDEDLKGDLDLWHDSTVINDHEKRLYKDFYKVIVDWETRSDWSTALKELKNELLNYQPSILLREKKRDDGVYKVLSGKNSYAFEGNILEAINLAMNPFDKHYVDRDLLRTGLSIVVVTPGCGRYEVDKKTLRVTTERFIDNGIGLDLVCLSKIPLHTVPLFKFKSLELSKAPIPEWFDQKTFGHKSQQVKDLMKPELRDPLDYDESPMEAKHTYYKTPDWIDCSFYSRHYDNPFKPDKFMTRCKMYEIQMMGIMEHEISSILIPYLNDSSDDIEKYDEQVFSAPSTNKLKQFSNISHNLDFTRPHDFAQLRYNDDHLISLQSQHSKNHPTELSRSLPKTLTSLMISNMHHDHYRQSNHVFKTPRLSGSNLIEPMTNSSNREKGLYRSHSHESFQEGNFKGKNQTEDDNESSFTSSNTMPMPIPDSQRSRRSTVNDSSPSGSFADSAKGSYSSDKSRYFPKQTLGVIASGPHYRSTLVNPCNPSKSSNRHGFGTHLRRWRHVFPRPLSKNSVKWTSLCTPACLPVTTDYFPPINEAGLYSENTYTISLEDSEYVTVTEEVKTENLLKEMICQRLAQGYQLIVPSSYMMNDSIKKQRLSVNSETLDNSSSFGNPEENLSKLLDISHPYYLSMGRHVHKLTYLPGQGVEVRIYIRKIQTDSNFIPYSCVVWPRCQKIYEPRKVHFSYPHTDYKWNYVDQLVCGYHNDLLEPLKFWRTRFLLIPMDNVPDTMNTADETLDAEEVRVNGIYRFIDLLEKAAWFPPHMRTEANNRESITPLKITTLDPSIFVKTPDSSYLRRMSVNPTDHRLTKDSNPVAIIQAMLNPAEGIVKDRHWHSKVYQNAIVGNEFVDWLLKKFSDIESRPDAVNFGNEMQEKGLIEHCTKRHQFSDEHFFYQIKENYAPRRPQKGWFMALFNHDHRKDSNKDDGNKDGNIKDGNSKDGNSKDGNIKDGNIKDGNIKDGNIKDGNIKDVIELSKAMLIDIDPSKTSDRRETAILHYDVIHNPDNCYHIQLNWLGCTARLIEDMLKKWSNATEKKGLKLVEVPVEQAMSLTENNPFQSPVAIKLAVQPPTLELPGKKLHPTINPHLYFETQLAKRFKFILDVEADSRFPDDIEIKYSYFKTPYKYSQYIHRSGVAFIQICNPGEGYLWVNNRLFTTHHNKILSNLQVNPDVLLREFQSFCENEVELRKFWEDVKNRILYIDEVEDL